MPLGLSFTLFWRQMTAEGGRPLMHVELLDGEKVLRAFAIDAPGLRAVEVVASLIAAGALPHVASIARVARDAADLLDPNNATH